MADENKKAGAYDPDAHKATEVVEHLEDASEEEKAAVATAERERDHPRKTVLEAAGVDPNARTDASGRVLNAWEVAPKKRDEG